MPVGIHAETINNSLLLRQVRMFLNLPFPSRLPLLALTVFCAGMAGSAVAAQESPAPAFARQPPPFPSWDMRIGGSTQGNGSRERGIVNFSGEVVSPRLLTLQDRVANAFVPRFHLGTHTNFGRATSLAYAGLTWTVNLNKTLFVEGSLGAAVNDGKTGYAVPNDRVAVGCNTGLREALGVGVKLNDRWSVTTTLEHFSNHGACDRSRSLSNFGARLGYTF